MAVGDVMGRDLPTCAPGESLRFVMAEMTRRRTRHLVIVDHGHLCGIVSIGDVVKERVDEAELEAAVLRDVALGRG